MGGGGSWTTSPLDSGHVEAKTLRIAIDKAIALMGWKPLWDLDETVRRTVDWYKEYYEGITSRKVVSLSLDPPMNDLSR
jgi:nucleoside-diphosphate-sugar epimerase